jgi:hypothetical protein
MKSSGKSINPYKNEGLNKIYNLLFCDNIDLYSSESKSLSYPWDVLFSKKPDIEKLKAITIDETLDSRQKILAFHLLLSLHKATDEKELLGVIIEVGLQEGLDVLAAFKDGTARYINHSEKMLIWETRTDQSDQLISKLFADSRNVVNRIGPWDKERKPFPANGMIRLTFLVSDGLYFGEGPFEVLEKDAMGGPVINSATQLMIYLTKHAT